MQIIINQWSSIFWFHFVLVIQCRLSVWINLTFLFVAQQLIAMIFLHFRIKYFFVPLEMFVFMIFRSIWWSQTYFRCTTHFLFMNTIILQWNLSLTNSLYYEHSLYNEQNWTKLNSLQKICFVEIIYRQSF